jgi:hypothetical protein
MIELGDPKQPSTMLNYVNGLYFSNILPYYNLKSRGFFSLHKAAPFPDEPHVKVNHKLIHEVYNVC